VQVVVVAATGFGVSAVVPGGTGAGLRRAAWCLHPSDDSTMDRRADSSTDHDGVRPPALLAGARVSAARRGMRAPVPAAGDGALGFWAALREVFPDTRAKRDWVHKTANVLAALPKSAHLGAKAALAEIWGAEDKTHAQTAAKRFADLYAATFAKAVAKITDNLDVLLTFYDYSAEHWVHLRTSNPIESTCATVRHRIRVTKGPGSRAAGPAMAFKLIEAAQEIDGFDHDFDAILVKATTVTCEAELITVLDAWNPRPEQFLHPGRPTTGSSRNLAAETTIHRS
jgi:hypothetical protein